MRAAAVLIPILAFAQENAAHLVKESALGPQLAVDHRRHSTELNNAAALNWLHDLTARLAPPNIPFADHTTITLDEPNTVREPVVYPGGYLFVPATQILACETEDEFAGLLAHAMAHLALRHGVSNFGQGTMFFDLTSGSPLPLSLKRQMPLWEREADASAARAMAAAGYDPEAFARYLERTSPADGAARAAAVRALGIRFQPTAHTAFESIQSEIRRALPEQQTPKAPPRLAR
jgi:predicted Zn-dependent protease